MTDPATPSPNPWDHIQGWDLEQMGAQLQDLDTRRTWAKAFAIAGGLSYIWRVAAQPINDVVYGLLEIHPGDKVLIIGEGIVATNWVEDMSEQVGPDGKVDTIEIILDGRRAVEQKLRGRNGRLGCWKWEYTADTPDEHYDCVAVLQSAQHCDDWSETFADLIRVVKPGRRIVFAEATLGGPTFLARVNSDVHLRQWHAKMFPAEMNFAEVSVYSGEELHELCAPLATDGQFMEWHGIEMFWARAPGR